MRVPIIRLLVLLSMFAAAARGEAATYMVGPGQTYATPSAIPWETLQPGDIVLIQWRSTPYTDKWVICRQGTAAAPIVVRGLPGPAGERPRWRWVSWGSGVAVLVWILSSVGFSLYVANFSSYNKTYGSLAAVIVLMLWLYLSAFAVLLGAEVDALQRPESERV